MAVYFYGVDGKRRILEGAELEAYEQREHERMLRDAIACAAELRADKNWDRFLKRCIAKGLSINKTRSTYGWRIRERPGSAIKAMRLDWMDAANESVWDYCPPGEPMFVRLMPRTRIANFEEYEITVIRKLPSGRVRRRYYKTMKSTCEDGSCGKPKTCARCWALENIQTGPDEIIDVVTIETNRPKVVDSVGINPHGTIKSNAQDFGEDQRAMFALTSTQHSHKEGASEW